MADFVERTSGYKPAGNFSKHCSEKIRNSLKGTNSKGAFSYSSLPPVTPADLPILRRHLSQGPKKLCVLATVVASTCGRSDELRQMRWQDVILAEGLWLYGCSVAYHS